MIETYNGITLIGTAHISKYSAKIVEEKIKSNQPDVVAVELDSMRLQKLLEEQEEHKTIKSLPIDKQKKSSKKKQKSSNSKLIKQVGLFGFLFLKIAGFAQKKMGKAFQIEPGVDMLSGVNTAKELEIPLFLADRPILHTIAEFKELSFLTKMSMVKRMIFTKMSYEEKKELATKIQNDKFDEKTILKIITTLKDNVPELYNILIHKRNVYMVNKLIQLKQKGYQNIIIVIGAGHLPGMLELLHEKLSHEDANVTHMSFKLGE